MWSKTMTCLVVLAASFVGDAQANLFKCLGKDGKVTYQADPCPVAAREQQLRAPAGSGAGASAAGPRRAGWGEEQEAQMRDNCIRQGLSNARSAWQSEAQRVGSASAFPESEFQSSLNGVCGCIARRVTSSQTFAEFSANPLGIVTSYFSDALNGGLCKPEGIMGQLLKPAQ